MTMTKERTTRAVATSAEQGGRRPSPHTGGAPLRLDDRRSTGVDTRDGEFDALLARMQTPQVRRAMKAAFGASAPSLGRAAVAAAVKIAT
jgi:hypothetical protein